MILRRPAARFAVSLLALCGAMHAAAADTAPSAEPASSLTVRHADLDLSRPEAARILYGRIQAAARRVCRASVTYHYLQTAHAREECVRMTVDDAVARTNLQLLSRLHHD
jgi:UrcA family protein